MPGKPNMLPPNMRERKRYIAFQVLAEEEIEFGNLVNGLWHSLLNLIGELETARCNAWVVKDKWNKDKQIGLVKCNHKHVKHVRSALALIEMLGDIKVVIKTLGVSGTMKGAEKKFFGEKNLTDFR